MDFSELLQGTIINPSTPLLIRLPTIRFILSLFSSELPKRTVYPLRAASSSKTRANWEKNGLEMSETTNPIVFVLPLLRLFAARLGW